MSATRVMGTTSVMGQAVGTAAAIAIRDGLTPRGVHEQRMPELQAALMDDDCYLPWHQRAIPELSRTATLSAHTGDVEALRNGIDRTVGETDNGWTAPCGTTVTYTFEAPRDVSEARLVFDSHLNRADAVHGPGWTAKNMRHFYSLEAPPWRVPEALVKRFRLEVQEAGGTWRVVHEADNNYQRLVRVPVTARATAVRLTPLETWGAPEAHVFAFDVR
jgi:hypothetical protein